MKGSQTMQQIKEEQGVHEDWYKEARKQTLETLPGFLKKLTEDYGHDYGTICHAIAAGAIGAAWAVERCPQGGITGFQASAVMWEFIQKWESIEGPLRLIRYELMLYPQYEEQFANKTIQKSTWEYLQKIAGEKLDNPDNGNAHGDVKKHWRSILNGQVPFGYEVAND